MFLSPCLSLLQSCYFTRDVPQSKLYCCVVATFRVRLYIVEDFHVLDVLGNEVAIGELVLELEPVA
jgi:hypothetical protein